MKNFILLGLMIFSSATFAAKKAGDVCEVCVQVDKLNKAFEDDETKAYEQFNDFLATVKLSSDKKIRALELKSIVSATPKFLKKDGPRELPDYLSDMKDNHPEEFATALQELSKEDREDLDKKITAAKNLMEKGEEP